MRSSECGVRRDVLGVLGHLERARYSACTSLRRTCLRPKDRQARRTTKMRNLANAIRIMDCRINMVKRGLDQVISAPFVRDNCSGIHLRKGLQDVSSELRMKLVVWQSVGNGCSLHSFPPVYAMCTVYTIALECTPQTGHVGAEIAKCV